MGPRFRPSLPWTPNVDFTGRPWGICSVPALPIRIKLKNRASSCQRGSFISNLSAAILSDSFARVDACGSCVPHDLHHRIIVGQNADKEVVGRRPLATEVTKRAAGELVAPDVCAQKCPRQGAAHPASVVSEVEVPQCLGGYLSNVRSVPTLPDCDRLFTAHRNHSVRTSESSASLSGKTERRRIIASAPIEINE